MGKIIVSSHALYGVLSKIDFEEIDPDERVEIDIKCEGVTIRGILLICSTYRPSIYYVDASSLHQLLRLLRLLSDQPLTIDFTNKLCIESILL